MPLIAASQYPQDKHGGEVQVGDVLGSHVPEFWDRNQRTVVGIRPAGNRFVAECGPGRFAVNLYASQLITVTGFNSPQAVASLDSGDTPLRTAGTSGTLTRTPAGEDGASPLG